MNFGNPVKLGPVDVFKREIVNQVSESFNFQFLIQQFSPFGTNSGKKFNFLFEKISHKANILKNQSLVNLLRK